MAKFNQYVKQHKLSFAIVFLLCAMLSVISFFSVRAYFYSRIDKSGEIQFMTLEVKLKKGSNDITASDLTVSSKLLPGHQFNYENLKVANTGEADLYALVAFDYTITKSGEDTITQHKMFNIEGEEVDLESGDIWVPATRLDEGESQNCSINFGLPTSLSNAYQGGNVTVTITAYATQAFMPTVTLTGAEFGANSISNLSTPLNRANNVVQTDAQSEAMEQLHKALYATYLLADNFASTREDITTTFTQPSADSVTTTVSVVDFTTYLTLLTGSVIDGTAMPTPDLYTTTQSDVPVGVTMASLGMANYLYSTCGFYYDSDMSKPVELTDRVKPNMVLYTYSCAFTDVTDVVYGAGNTCAVKAEANGGVFITALPMAMPDDGESTGLNYVTKLNDLDLSSTYIWVLPRTITSFDGNENGIIENLLFMSSPLSMLVTYPESIDVMLGYLSLLQAENTDLYVGKNACWFGDLLNVACLDLSIPEITSITVDEDNPYLYSQNNCIITKNGGIASVSLSDLKGMYGLDKAEVLLVGCQNSVIPTDGSIAGLASFAFVAVPIDYLFIPKSVRFMVGTFMFYCRAKEVEFEQNSNLMLAQNVFGHSYTLKKLTLPCGFDENRKYCLDFDDLVCTADPQNALEEVVFNRENAYINIDSSYYNDSVDIMPNLTKITIASNVQSVEIANVEGLGHLTEWVMEDKNGWMLYYDRDTMLAGDMTNADPIEVIAVADAGLEDPYDPYFWAETLIANETYLRKHYVVTLLMISEAWTSAECWENIEITANTTYGDVILDLGSRLNGQPTSLQQAYDTSLMFTAGIYIDLDMEIKLVPSMFDQKVKPGSVLYTYIASFLSAETSSILENLDITYNADNTCVINEIEISSAFNNYFFVFPEKINGHTLIEVKKITFNGMLPIVILPDTVKKVGITEQQILAGIMDFGMIAYPESIQTLINYLDSPNPFISKNCMFISPWLLEMLHVKVEDDITLDPQNPYLQIKNNCLLTKNGSIFADSMAEWGFNGELLLVGLYQGKPTIPTNFDVYIMSLAFYKHENLTGELFIPNSVKGFGWLPFTECRNLDSVVFEPGYQGNLSPQMFETCVKKDNSNNITGGLSSVTIPDGKLGGWDDRYNNLFSGCGNISSITFNGKNVNISANPGGMSEYYFPNLTQLTFDVHVQTIHFTDISGLTHLTSIVIEAPEGWYAYKNGDFTGDRQYIYTFCTDDGNGARIDNDDGRSGIKLSELLDLINDGYVYFRKEISEMVPIYNAIRDKYAVGFLYRDDTTTFGDILNYVMVWNDYSVYEMCNLGTAGLYLDPEMTILIDETWFDKIVPADTTLYAYYAQGYENLTATSNGDGTCNVSFEFIMDAEIVVLPRKVVVDGELLLVTGIDAIDSTAMLLELVIPDSVTYISPTALATIINWVAVTTYPDNIDIQRGFVDLLWGGTDIYIGPKAIWVGAMFGLLAKEVVDQGYRIASVDVAPNNPYLKAGKNCILTRSHHFAITDEMLSEYGIIYGDGELVLFAYGGIDGTITTSSGVFLPKSLYACKDLEHIIFDNEVIYIIMDDSLTSCGLSNCVKLDAFTFTEKVKLIILYSLQTSISRVYMQDTKGWMVWASGSDFDNGIVTSGIIPEMECVDTSDPVAAASFVTSCYVRGYQFWAKNDSWVAVATINGGSDVALPYIENATYGDYCVSIYGSLINSTNALACYYAANQASCGLYLDKEMKTLLTPDMLNKKVPRNQIIYTYLANYVDDDYLNYEDNGDGTCTIIRIKYPDNPRAIVLPAMINGLWVTNVEYINVDTSGDNTMFTILPERCLNRNIIMEAMLDLLNKAIITTFPPAFMDYMNILKFVDTDDNNGDDLVILNIGPKTIYFLTVYRALWIWFGCDAIINIDPTNPYLERVDNCIVTKNGSVFSHLLARMGLSGEILLAAEPGYKLPNNICLVCPAAFMLIEDSTLTLPTAALMQYGILMSNLKNIVFTGTNLVVNLPSDAIVYCPGLTRLTVAKNVESILLLDFAGYFINDDPVYLTDIVIEDPYGWRIYDNTEYTDGIIIPADQLKNSKTALSTLAQYYAQGYYYLVKDVF